MTGHDQAEQEDLVVGQVLRKPSGKTGNREDAERKRQSPEHLHHAEIVIDLLLRARRAVGVVAGHDLRAHGIGHDVLQDHAGHADERSNDVDLIGRQHRDPAAGGTGQQNERKGDEAGADEHVGAALRTEQRHGVDQLAEHHFDGPRQGEPDGQRGQLRGRPGQGVLDPEALGDAHETHRAIGEIDHQEGQVRQPQGADRRQQRILDLLPPIGGGCGLAGVHGLSPAWGPRRTMQGSQRAGKRHFAPAWIDLAPLQPCNICSLSKTAALPFSRWEQVFPILTPLGLGCGVMDILRGASARFFWLCPA